MLPYVKDRLAAISSHGDPRIALWQWAKTQWDKAFFDAIVATNENGAGEKFPGHERMEKAYEAANELLELSQMLPTLITELRRTGADGSYEAKKPCNDCGAEVGKPHKRGCDIARCMICGGQRLSCGCRGASKDIWTGKWPGTEECERFGFWCIGDGPPGNHWRQVPAGTPGAVHDLNRLMIETVWNPKTKARELRKKT